MTDAVHAPAGARVSDAHRWAQLAIGVGAMVMIANYQYGWTFFVSDIQKKFGWDRASIQLAFTLFVLSKPGWWLVRRQTWPAPGGSGWRRSLRHRMGHQRRSIRLLKGNHMLQRTRSFN